MTEDKRIINWNAGMQNDFHYLASNSENGLWLIYNFAESDEEDYPSLSVYYHSLNNEDKTQFAQDLIDLYTGKARFPEQKYYVKLLDKEEGYLNYQKSFNDYFANNNKYGSDYQTQFTISEIEAIDPRYKAFAIPVEEG